MRAALADGGVGQEQIGYINAHGTGTIANDATEASAIREVFASPPPLSSTKSMHGHALGGRGRWESAAAIGALMHRSASTNSEFHYARSRLRSGRDSE